MSIGLTRLAAVQNLLGHKEITTTMRYAHLAPEHLQSAVERLRFGHHSDTNPQMQPKKHLGKST